MFLREAGTAIRLQLGNRLAEAGEGTVYELRDRPDKVLKVYKEARSPSHIAKLERLIGMCTPALAKCCAWPEALVWDASGRVVGFLMRRAEGLPMHQLYHPTDRQTYFPNATWRSLAAIALNVTSAFETIHAHGALMADVNHSNLLVSAQTGLVTLIDCDSYQIAGANGEVYRCEVGVPEWTPGELQGIDFSTKTRTLQNEAFGVALMLFHILNNGWHPYQGIPKPQSTQPKGIAGAIQSGAFAFTMARDVPVLPHPGRLQNRDFPKPLWEAFEAAFGLHPEHRPDAGQWRVLLTGMFEGIQKCGFNERHYFAREAGDCPWCRIRLSGMGDDVFLGLKKQPTLKFLSAELDLFRALAPEFLETVDVTGSGVSRSGALEAGAASGLQTHEQSVSLFNRLVSHLGRITGSGSVTRDVMRDGEVWRQKWKVLLEELQNLVKERWALVCSYQSDFQKLKQRLLTDLETHLEELKQAQISPNHIPVNPYWQQHAYLLECRIEDHDIPKLGQKRLDALLASGIRTAADVTPEGLCGIPWVGPVYQKRILKWAERCLRQFRLDPNRPLGREARIRLENYRIHVGETLQTELEMALSTLAGITGNYRVAVARKEDRIVRLLEELKAARETFEALAN